MGSGREELGPELALKFSTPLHPSAGRGRRILKREALCRQLPLRFWRLEAGQNEEVLEVHSGFKEVRSGLKAALVGLIGCRAGLKAFVEAAGGSTWFLGLWGQVRGRK